MAVNGRRLRSATLLIVAILLVITGCTGTVPSEPTSRPQARVGAATLIGKRDAKVDEFLGIPYAAPPVGDRRWKAPQLAPQMTGVWHADRFADNCAQLAKPFGEPSTSEDCLYLNVYRPATQRAGVKSPVMVWIPGGGFMSGAADLYNPAPLVERGVVVVTINYRVGALGFLAHSSLADADGQSGDYGLMDQQAALRWVQRSIADFGGDRDNVTIFGESAGGLSVLAQIASPAAEGLFGGAIAESGSYGTHQQSLAVAEAAGRQFADKVGCADQSAECLRDAPVSKILQAQSGEYRPNLNTEILPQAIQDAFMSGAFNRVPVINGSNEDEWRLFVAADEQSGAAATTADSYISQIASTLGVSQEQATAIALNYSLTAFPSPALALGAVGTDAIFACPALAVDAALSQYVPTRAYEFVDRDAPEVFFPPEKFQYGASHASELQFLFDLPKAAYPGTLTQPERVLARNMESDWTMFSTTHLAHTRWPVFTPSTQAMKRYGASGDATTTAFANEHHCTFWNAARP